MSPRGKTYDAIDQLAVQVTGYSVLNAEESVPALEWLRIASAASQRGLKPHTLRNWIETGKVPCLILDKMHFLRLKDLDEYLAVKPARADDATEVAEAGDPVDDGF